MIMVSRFKENVNRLVTCYTPNPTVLLS